MIKDQNQDQNQNQNQDQDQDQDRTINLEDGREAPSKARKKGAKRLEFLVCKYMFICSQCCIRVHVYIPRYVYIYV